MLLLHAAAAGCRCCPPVQRRIRHENQVKLSRLNDVLTVRSRLITGNLATGRPNKQPWAEDASMPSWTLSFFKVLPLAPGMCA
jgi:hypothetical protein